MQLYIYVMLSDINAVESESKLNNSTNKYL